jgi:hypothetical protein
MVDAVEIAEKLQASFDGRYSGGRFGRVGAKNGSS